MLEIDGEELRDAVRVVVGARSWRDAGRRLGRHPATARRWLRQWLDVGSGDTNADVELARECDRVTAARLRTGHGRWSRFVADMVVFAVEARRSVEERELGFDFWQAVFAEVERRTQREREKEKEEEDGLMRCELCDGRFRSLGHHLAAKHRLKVREYRAMVGLPPNARLTSEATHLLYQRRNVQLHLDRFVRPYRFRSRRPQEQPAVPPLCSSCGEPLLTVAERLNGVCRACLVPGARLWARHRRP